ncbi:MAG: divergent polysaccharide deacetylase family protein [Desulfobacterales bacterium]|nr:MAG: divergent polysaccharide deacetylase family protein [Desulfobacterales bacterium]
MTDSKSKRKKKRPAKSRRRKKIFPLSLLKAGAGLAFLLLLIGAAGFWANYMLSHRPTRLPEPNTVATRKPDALPPPPPKAALPGPAFEVFPPEKVLPAQAKDLPEVLPPSPVAPLALPKVAIIIDDLGYDSKIAEKFLDLDAVLTFSVLPHSPSQKKIIRLARADGYETMLHLPMEPVEYPTTDPGPGTLLTSMTADQLISQLEQNLDAVPFVRGVNNHMGSKMTAASSQMNQVFTVLKKRGLFFIDSRTSLHSLCKPSARLLQVRFAQRDVFIDHQRDADFIRRQIRELVRIAHRNGEAVGIAHPHQTTYAVLKEMLPELKQAVQLVPASEIVHIVG